MGIPNSESSSQQPSGADLAGTVNHRVRRTYLIALTLVATTSLCAFLMGKKIIATEETTAAIVNASGKRRMTSQRMAFFALQAVESESVTDRDQARRSLKESTDEFEECHEGLIHGSSRLHLPGNPSQDLRRLYYEPPHKLDQTARAYVQTARRLLDTPDGQRKMLAHEIRDMLKTGTGPLLASLERAVALYQRESELNVDSLQTTEAAIFAFTLLLLLIEGLFIFRPMEARLARTVRELDSTGRAVGSILNSLGQGFVMVDKNGICSMYCSSACVDLLECDPAGKPLSQVIGVKRETTSDFNAWLAGLFDENIPFIDLLPFAPKQFQHSQGKFVTLEWKAVRNGGGKVQQVVVVATDRTAENAATLALEREKAFVAMVMKLVRKRDQFLAFIKKTRERLDTIQDNVSSGDHKSALLQSHTIKGGAALFSLVQVRNAAAQLESALLETSGKSASDAGPVKTEVARLRLAFENAVRVAAEIIGLDLHGAPLTREIPLDQLKIFTREIDSLREAKKIKAKFVNEFIEEPVGKFFDHYQEYADALAERLGKEAPKVNIVNGELKLSLDPYLSLFDSLVHALRNAVDHGIERAEQRVDEGKEPYGHIELEFKRDKNSLVIEFRDDGRGVDVEAVRSALRRSGRVQEAESKNEQTVIQCILDSRLSTQARAHDISGLGVGLNAIQVQVKALGGQVGVNSTRGRGMALKIQVPWYDMDHQDEDKAKAA